MNGRTDVDVVVVGGRVAGAATAMLLARGGARVLLLERGERGADTLSTHGLMPAGVLQLSRWGLLDRVVAAGTPPVRSTRFHLVGRAPFALPVRDRTGVAALYAPRRQVLDRILVDAAADAGADVRHGTHVTGLLRAGDGRVAGVRLVAADGREQLVRAAYVVGADGVRSLVAREAGAGQQQRGDHASSVRYTYLSGVGTACYEWGFGNGAAAGLIPTNDGLHCAFVATTPERMRTLRLGRTPDELLEVGFRLAAPALAGQLAAGRRVERHHGWAGVQGFRRRPWGPGWALVGDAGSFKDPISSRGISDALRDSELLARALLDSLAQAHPEAEALGRYHQLRDRLSGDLLEVADRVASYAWSDGEVPWLLRRMSAATADEADLLGALTPIGRAVGPATGSILTPAPGATA